MIQGVEARIVRRGRSPVDRLSELFGERVQFRYTCLDRIVLQGYLTGLQRPGQLVHFFHDVVGVDCIEPKVLLGRTTAYREWVDRYTQGQGIPVLAAPKGVRKEEVVRPFYGKLGPQAGIACVLTSLETNRTFISYTPQRTPRSGDENYRRIEIGRKRFLHLYWYVWDPVMGPMSLRVSTYLPFTLTAYLNGHHFVNQRLRQAGVGLYQQDNAILRVADPVALQVAADALTPAVLQERCDYWAAKLAPSFSPAERAAVDLRYRYSLAQVELATDVIFAEPSPLRALFRRAVELGLLMGGADRTAHLFGRQITSRYRGKLQTVLDRRNEGHPVLRAYYQTSFVKQYEKAETLLRTETCINDPYHLNVGRRLENLPKLVTRMADTNQRFLDVQAELLACTVDQGELARLAQPVQVGKRRVPGLRLQDDRVIRLLDVLLHPGSFVADWTSRDVLARLLDRHRLTDTDYRLSQLRYDLGKLRAHGLVERIGRTRRYRLTARGLKLGVLLVKLRSRLLGPLVTLVAAASLPPDTATDSAVEAAFHQVDRAIDHLCITLGLNAAA
jgi:DNA-binding transcriptional ArsR family regulator